GRARQDRRGVENRTAAAGPVAVPVAGPDRAVVPGSVHDAADGHAKTVGEGNVHDPAALARYVHAAVVSLVVDASRRPRPGADRGGCLAAGSAPVAVS